MTGKPFVLSAPSGTGKTTLCNRLLSTTRRLVRSISVTTRRPRRGETEGKDYLFISKKEFYRLRRTGGLLEWTSFSGAYYGTPLRPLNENLANGKDVLLLLDGRGARAVKKRFKGATTIFLLPPSFETLERRLSGRKSEKPSEIRRRLRIAGREMRQSRWYDYAVVNDDLNRALRRLKQIIQKKHLRREG